MGQDVRLLVPRVRRALEPSGAEALTDDQVKDLVADAIAEVILYSEGSVEWTLSVTETENDIPVEYAIDPALDLPEQTVVANQAALNHYFHVFNEAKMSERIRNPAYEWEYARSANLIVAQFQQLVAERDKALEALADVGAPLDSYVSFLSVRDAYTAALVEPWVAGGLPSGQENFRGV